MQGYGSKPPSGHIYPGSGRTADSSSQPPAPDALSGSSAAAPAAAVNGHAEDVVEDPEEEFVGLSADLPHPPGAPRIINVGIEGPGEDLGQLACISLAL